VPEAVGFVPPSELGPFYERAALVCVPSRREGYGVTAREAMAYGRPVVATRVGGLAELEVAATLVPVGDVDALRSALVRLMGDEEARSSAAALTREFVSRSLSTDRVGESLAALYTSVTA